MNPVSTWVASPKNGSCYSFEKSFVQNTVCAWPWPMHSMTLQLIRYMNSSKANESQLYVLFIVSLCFCFCLCKGMFRYDTKSSCYWFTNMEVDDLSEFNLIGVVSFLRGPDRGVAKPLWLGGCVHWIARICYFYKIDRILLDALTTTNVATCERILP